MTGDERRGPIREQSEARTVRVAVTVRSVRVAVGETDESG
jgi:hypothetical protein